MAVVVVMGMSSCYDAITKQTSVAEKYQQELKAFYENPETTPLKGAEVEQFKGITFFPINKDYIVDARFAPIMNGKVIALATSANKVKRYKEYGTANFELDNVPSTLTLYTMEPSGDGQEDYLFIPFKDATSGTTSYGAGRYLELKTRDIKQGHVQIDFNMAYNPYCAYSESYNCPLPPENNYLEVAIPAGVSYNHQ